MYYDGYRKKYMTKIKYINANVFFAKEYKDGTIVAFKNIGDNNHFYAEQIHQIVLKNFGVDLFVSDIIESISGTDTLKAWIKNSLFIYLKNNISISACGIGLCPNKDYIEVRYCSQYVLSIKKKQSNKFWKVFILFIICVLGYNLISGDDKTNDCQDLIHSLDIQPQTEESIKEATEDNVSVNIVADNKEAAEDNVSVNVVADNKEATLIKANDTNSAIEEVGNESNANNETNVSTSEKITTSNIPNAIHSSDKNKKEKKENSNTKISKKNAIKAEGDKYIQIADKAYNEYANSFNESKGIVALTNYRKALDLNKKYGLFSVSKRERIVQKVIY